MELIKLKANTRTDTGKGPGRALRREGKIPAVLYGQGRQPVMLSVDIVELETILRENKGAQVILNLAVQDGDKKSRTAMLKELQTHPLSRKYLHADFYEVDMARKIRVNVPVVATGTSQGVEMGGMLQVIRRELEVECLPTDIPEAIEIDITELNIGDSIHVDEIPLEGDVEIPAEVNFTVLTILSPSKAAEGEAGEEAELEGEEGAETEGEAEPVSDAE